MNFKHLPELERSLGYPLFLVVMALICRGCTASGSASASPRRPS